ncbi:MAG: SDR family NAD(P)-dependent oxidoreductase [Candidatus Binatia bacterium]
MGVSSRLNTSTPRLEGKVALVTGSTRGIGEEIAYRFAEEGAKVVVTGRDVDRGTRVAQKIQGSGGGAIFLPADLGRESDVAGLVAGTVQAFGGLNILVNNAAPNDLIAASSDKCLADHTTEEFDAVVKVMLYGTFWCCKYTIPHLLRAGGGSIVNVSSIISTRGFSCVPASTAAKGGMNALTRQIATDYGTRGIRANAIIVGVIIHELTAGMVATPELKEAVYNLHLTPRPGVCADVADLVVYLGSDESAFMTACELVLDGGATMKGVPAALADQVKKSMEA